MKKVLQRIIVIVCMMVMTVAVFPATGMRAAYFRPKAPKISVKAVNGTDVEITIGKTEGADGYEVWITSDCGYTGYKDYNLIFGGYDYDYYPGDYINAATVEKDGTAVRTVTIKNLSKASVSIKVRAYYGTHYTDGFNYNKRKDYDGNICTTYGGFSKAKTVKVTAQEKGYKSSYDFSEVKKGDTIKFGTYEQDYPVDGKDPIEWAVLDKTEDSIFVMSKYALDCLPYNKVWSYETWQSCTLREWLNEKFYNAAFNETEKTMIRETTVRNKDNPYYGTWGGKGTKDKVFLLSTKEAKQESYGFDTHRDASDINRRCAPSRYAVAQGACCYAIAADNEATCDWWLRSPGMDNDFATFVGSEGGIGYRGVSVGYGASIGSDLAVRPVMVLDLKS